MTISPQIARGHEEPFAVQFSVFLPNRVGQLREMLEMFSTEKLRIVGLSVVDSTDWAVMRLVCSDTNKTREMLKKHNHAFTESEVLLAVMTTDETFVQIASLLVAAEINIHFAYPLTIRSDDLPVIVLHVEDNVTATHILTKHNVTLLGYEDLKDSI